MISTVTEAIDKILDDLAGAHTFALYVNGSPLFELDLGGVIVWLIAFALAFGVFWICATFISKIALLAAGNNRR